MFDNYDDWLDWTYQSASSDPTWVLPGGAGGPPFGILYNAMFEYVLSEPRYSQQDWAVRTHYPWLEEIVDYMEYVDSLRGL